MPYSDIKVTEHLMLEPEEWTTNEWRTICKLFNTPTDTLVIKVTIDKLEVFTND